MSGARTARSVPSSPMSLGCTTRPVSRSTTSSLADGARGGSSWLRLPSGKEWRTLRRLPGRPEHVTLERDAGVQANDFAEPVLVRDPEPLRDRWEGGVVPIEEPVSISESLELPFPDRE